MNETLRGIPPALLAAALFGVSTPAKAMVGRTTWLGTERWESGTQEAGRPAPAVQPGRLGSLASLACSRIVKYWRFVYG